MRRTLAGTLAAVVLAGVMAVATQVMVGGVASPARAVAADPYSWRNVRIDGGGFVPGIVFNETERDLFYARTDIGGAYRWNQADQSWIPLLDWVGWDRWGWNGVLSLATDPVQTNRLYAAVGMYTNDWDPNNGAILRSTDKGDTWQATELPFKVGGNMPGRGMGERLAVDPNDNRVVYFGAENGNGLWRSTDHGQSWAEVTSFPNPGNWAEDPADPNGYLDHQPGVVWVTFDEATGSAGSRTPHIYVGVADLQNTVYRSTDAGVTWQRLAGQPTGFIAHQGEIDHATGTLYIATSDNGGPYAGDHGDVWKYATATGEWTRISPTPSDDTANNWYGYSGLSVDRSNPGTLMVTGYSSWWPDTFIYRSTDGGATWTSFYDIAYPNRTNHYTMDISDSPWLSWGANPQPPEVTPKLGWMTEALAIDPHDPDRFMYGTGATIYGSTNLTALDDGGTVAIRTMVEGLEETAVLDLVSPPTGDAFLISGLGDIGGFRHTDPDTVPAMMHDQPNLSGNTSIDYAELNPQQMVRVGNGDSGVSHIAYSYSSGANWYAGSEPAGVTSGGTVAVAADGGAVVWSPGGVGVHHATSFGGGFSPSTGVPAGARVEADRVDGETFYAYADGQFYVSTDGGRSFAVSVATGLPAEQGRFAAVAGHEGHIWLAGDSGLFRSTDSGATFSRVAGVTAGRNVGFGKGAPGAGYHAVFLVGTIDGVTGVFRSDDTGASWVRINDDQHQYGNMGDAITGDPRVYGRVYLGTNGRGILMADRLGAPPSPTVGPTPSVSPSASPSPSVSPTTGPSPSVSPSGSPTPGPTTPPPGGCTAVYQVVGSWQGGFQGEVRVTNTGSAGITGWTVTWTFPDGQRITQLWGGQHTQTGDDVTARNVSWNGDLGPGASTTLGFLADWTAGNRVPAGVSCAAD
ncbi:cellulose binding domain-containing protein [Micromonospora sp. Llam0]|uniref:cellulose binding domain-containing protein n=1 Tax=Micromonospora sp. Llam0 TaxID=2485143 RepID=UPI000F493DE9|nr:cellulose binding domain-containing protein [Micromonospora sp. Llam0]ROO61620.1 cellulose binding domain-containing protein [Micromonospora sp. Llam0]